MTLLFRKPKLALASALVLLLMGVVAVFGPWKSLLEERIENVLEGQGLHNVHLTISGIGFNRLTIHNFTWGEGAERQALPAIPEISFDYSFWDLFAARIQSVSLNGLALDVRKTEGGWVLPGLEVSAASRESRFSLPVTENVFDAVPLERFRLDDGRLTFHAEDWGADIPLRIVGWKKPYPHLSLQSEGIGFWKRGAEVKTEGIDLQATLNPMEGAWSGEWSAKKIKAIVGDMAFPELKGIGNVFAKEDRVVLAGDFVSEDSLTQAAFQFTYMVSEPQTSKLVLTKASFPWNEGVLSVHDVTLPFLKPADVHVDMKFQKVALNALLRQLMGNRASGTGLLSGALPISVDAKGGIVVRDGALSAEGPGTIHMEPDVIPGDNPQVSLVRQVLTNLIYTVLIVEVRNEPKHGASIHMKVEGYNPDVYAGRPVRLNVRLGGDVLGFIQQNLSSLTNPRKFLEQNGHATP